MPGEKSSEKPENNAETKACPFCAEEIKKDAIKCKHCGSMLDGSQSPKEKPEPQRADKKIDLNRLDRVVQNKKEHPRQPLTTVNVNVPAKGYIGASVVTLILYIFLFPIGLIVNIAYMISASGEKKRTGQTPSGGCCLSFLLLWFFLIPVVLIVIVVVGGASSLGPLGDFIEHCLDVAKDFVK